MLAGGGITYRARHGGQRLGAIASGSAERPRQDLAVDAQHGVLALLPETDVPGDGGDIGQRESVAPGGVEREPGAGARTDQ